eukprot:TRINITY_DN69660_c0_g1_i1.p1 TRINITY_DN69660_c0_g1~~TRINITY_DN69660_c0_g1_i1.p1  ORF type:complete len:174 (-),score=29.09 TRINITY_DN69660_c0_g1_i1:67-588(-)
MTSSGKLVDVYVTDFLGTSVAELELPQWTSVAEVRRACARWLPAEGVDPSTLRLIFDDQVLFDDISLEELGVSYSARPTISLLVIKSDEPLMDVHVTDLCGETCAHVQLPSAATFKDLEEQLVEAGTASSSFQVIFQDMVLSEDTVLWDLDCDISETSQRTLSLLLVHTDTEM